MLRGIPEIIPPELMLALMQMGHGDDIVLGDINFPSYSTNNRCVNVKGHTIKDLLDAILDFFPLDTFVDDAVTVMRPYALEVFTLNFTLRMLSSQIAIL